MDVWARDKRQLSAKEHYTKMRVEEDQSRYREEAELKISWNGWAKD